MWKTRIYSYGSASPIRSGSIIVLTVSIYLSVIHAGKTLSKVISSKISAITCAAFASRLSRVEQLSHLTTVWRRGLSVREIGLTSPWWQALVMEERYSDPTTSGMCLAKGLKPLNFEVEAMCTRNLHQRDNNIKSKTNTTRNFWHFLATSCEQSDGKRNKSLWKTRICSYGRGGITYLAI